MQWGKIQSHQRWRNERKVLKKSNYIQICQNSSRNRTKMAFLFHYHRRRNHQCVRDLRNRRLPAWLLILQSLGMLSSCVFFHCYNWFLKEYKLNMIWIVWFSLNSSVKVRRIFDCLSLVICSIENLGSWVESEAFSKIISKIANEMAIAGNSSATDIEHAIPCND